MAHDEHNSDRPYAPIFHEAWRQSFGMPSIPRLGRSAQMKKDSVSGEIPGGKRSNNFRGGTRSEYLAHYGISRFAFVYPVPYQEDFGVVDFICTLGNVKKPTLVYPENAFYVQVKSNTEKFHFSEDSINWIANHMDLPLFLCVATKPETLSFYSFAMMWELLFYKTNISGITFSFERKHKESIHELLPCEERAYQKISHEIFLGEPIFKQTLTDIDADNGDMAFRVLKPWIDQESINVTSKKIGGLLSIHITNCETNKEPDKRRFYQYYYEKDYSKAEVLIAEQLVALAFNYKGKLHRMNDELTDDEKAELINKIKHIQDYLQLLDLIDVESALHLDAFISRVDKLPLGSRP